MDSIYNLGLGSPFLDHLGRRKKLKFLRKKRHFKIRGGFPRCRSGNIKSSNYTSIQNHLRKKSMHSSSTTASLKQIHVWSSGKENCPFADPKSQSVGFRSEIFLQKNGRERIEQKQKKTSPFPLPCQDFSCHREGITISTTLLCNQFFQILHLRKALKMVHQQITQTLSTAVSSRTIST